MARKAPPAKIEIAPATVDWAPKAVGVTFDWAWRVTPAVGSPACGVIRGTRADAQRAAEEAVERLANPYWARSDYSRARAKAANVRRGKRRPAVPADESEADSDDSEDQEEPAAMVA